MIKKRKLSALYVFIILLFTFSLSSVFVSAVYWYSGTLNMATLDAKFLGQDPDPAEPGDIVELRWNIVNNASGVLTDVKMKLAVEYPFSIYHGFPEIKELGDIQYADILQREDKTSHVVLYYKLKVDADAVEGDYNIRLYHHTSNEKYGEWIPLLPETIRVRSKIAQISVDNFRTIPEKIKPGSSGKLLIKLTNTGNNDLKDIKVKLDLDDSEFSPVGTTDEKMLKLIQRGYSSMVEYELLASADAEAKEYKIPIEIKYKDEFNDNYTVENKITVMMDSTPDYLLALEDTKVYERKKSGKVVLSISNVGQSELKYMSMRLIDSDDYSVIGKHEEYVGNLESDDFETADFDIYVGKTKKKNIPLKVQLIFKDSYNNGYTEQKEVYMNLYSHSLAIKLGLAKRSKMWWFLAVGLLVILAGYFYYVKKYKGKERKK